MAIAGMLIAIIVLVVSFYILGPYGVCILLIILFGYTLSTYHRTKQIHEDIKEIKNKLGLLNEEEKMEMDMKNSEKEFEMSRKDPELELKINNEIEEELKNYINETEDKDNHTKK
ncbi:hypothetical protein [Paenibacillus sp. PL2-23]|uniref:hypothetical protein n=1 Tax=Paenibacillus sp. PL2-23 TaxID=2100729 RepID=UPI0030FB601A